jgi:hypothetical protein
LGLAEAEFLLEVLVHDVDHAVAHSPKEEQRTDENKREHEVVPVFAYEETLLVCAHGGVKEDSNAMGEGSQWERERRKEEKKKKRRKKDKKAGGPTNRVGAPARRPHLSYT